MSVASTRAPRALAVALASAAVLLGGCSSREGRIESGLEKGAEHVKGADWDKASVEVRNVLQIDPKNAGAYYIAGQVSEGKGEVQRAFASYSKAIELRPDHLEAKIGLARVYLLANHIDKAEQTIGEVLAARPDDHAARTIRAALLARKNDVQGSIAEAKALLAARPGAPPIDTTMLLAGLYSAQGDGTRALEVVESALAVHKDNLGLLQVAAQITAGSAEPAMRQRTAGYLKRAAEQSPKNIELWNVWASHHARANELDRAEEVLRASIKAQPDDSQRTLALLDFLSSRRGPEVAEKEYLAAIASRPKDAALRFGLVDLYRLANRPEDARRVLNDIIALDGEAPAALTARNRLAADLLSRDKLPQAGERVAEVLKANPRDGTALVMRARMLLAKGDAQNAILDLRSALRDQPASAEIVGLLAQAHRRNAEPQLAREVLVDAVKFKPDSGELRLQLAADLADAKDWRAALGEIDETIRREPRNLKAWDMKALVAMAQNDKAGAADVYAAMKTRLPGDPIGFIRLGRFHAEQKRFDAALKEYDGAAKVAPQATEPVLLAVGALIAQKRYDEAGARVESMAGKAGTPQVLPHQLRGDIAVARGDLPLADRSYRAMIELDPAQPAGYQSLARVKALQKDMSEAIAVLERGEKANPREPSLPAMRAEWLVRAGRHGEAIDLYEGLLKASPENDAYANNLAYLLTEMRGDKASLERAATLAARLGESSNPGYLDTLGWVNYKLGRFEQAVGLLEQAARRAPDSALLQLHLGMALHKSGNRPKAEEHLRKALASKSALPNQDEARAMLARSNQ